MLGAIETTRTNQMNITDILAQVGGLRSMARELGISEAQAESGASALAPAILGGFKKQAQAQPTGLEGLGGLLGQLGGGNLLDNVLASQPTDVSQGNNVLGQKARSACLIRTARSINRARREKAHCEDQRTVGVSGNRHSIGGSGHSFPIAVSQSRKRRTLALAKRDSVATRW